MECTFCKKSYSSTSALSYHQRTTKSCLKIQEEMGISNIDMWHLFTFFYEDDRVRCYGDAWEMEFVFFFSITVYRYDAYQYFCFPYRCLITGMTAH